VSLAGALSQLVDELQAFADFFEKWDELAAGPAERFKDYPKG
jgi:hypothetical protein